SSGRSEDTAEPGEGRPAAAPFDLAWLSGRAPGDPGPRRPPWVPPSPGPSPHDAPSSTTRPRSGPAPHAVASVHLCPAHRTTNADHSPGLDGTCMSDDYYLNRTEPNRSHGSLAHAAPEAGSVSRHLGG